MRSVGRARLAALALDAVQDGDTRRLARKYRVTRSTIYRWLQILADAGVLRKTLGECAYAKGEKWSEWFDGIDSDRWTTQAGSGDSQDSQNHYLVGSTKMRMPPKSPRLASGLRLENPRRLYELVAPIPPDLLRLLRPFARCRDGRIASWAGEVHYPHGTAQFHVGERRGTVQLILKRQYFDDGTVGKDPSEVEAWMDKVYAWWARGVERDLGVKLTARGLPIPDPRARGRPGALSTGHLEKSLEDVEAVGRAALSETARTDDSPPGPSVDTVDLNEAQRLARAALSGGLEGIEQRLAAIQEAMAKDREEIVRSLQHIADILELLTGAWDAGQAGRAPPGGPGYA